MFKKMKYWKFKKNKIKSITSYQWLVLDIGTENLKCKHISIGLKYNIPTYLAENYEKNIIFYGEDAKELINKTNQNIFINAQFVMVILLMLILYNVFLLKFFKISDLKLEIENKLTIFL